MVLEGRHICQSDEVWQKPLKPYEVFIANVEAGSDKHLIIKDLVESYSLAIGHTKNYGVICAVSQCYDKFGYHVLDRTLRLCVGAWEGDMNSLSANFLNGVARLVVAFGNSIKDDLFKEKVGFMSVKQLSRTAKERRPGSLGYTEAMLVAYNLEKMQVSASLGPFMKRILEQPMRIMMPICRTMRPMELGNDNARKIKSWIFRKQSEKSSFRIPIDLDGITL